MKNTTSFGHEDQTTEFKSCITESANHKDDQMFVVFKAACAMMNTDGGKIYIGVNDEGYPVHGKFSGVKGDLARLHLKNNDSYARYINKMISSYFVEDRYVRGIMHAEETDNEDVIVITVQEADRVIFMRNKSGEKFAYRREGASSRQMNQSMICQRKSEISGKKKSSKATRRLNDNWQTIHEAIQNKRKIKVYGYISSNSNVKSDRILEPSCFICDDRSIWAYEAAKAEDSHMRQFKISRMGYVELLDESWEHEDKHSDPIVDAFEWSRVTEPQIEICMALGPKAYNYLLENAPRSKDYITEASYGVWIFNAQVHSLDPVKTFCKACSDIIEVYCPDELREELGLAATGQQAKTVLTKTEEAETIEMHEESFFTKLINSIKGIFTNKTQAA